MAGVRMYDLRGQEFKNWKVEDFAGKSYYTCRCSLCNCTKRINGYHLRNGNIPRCDCQKNKVENKATGFNESEHIDTSSLTGNKRANSMIKNNLSGMQFGLWKVHKYAGSGGMWECECQCDKHTVRNIKAYRLTAGLTKSCGCAAGNDFIDLSGQKINEFEVLEYVGDRNFRCRCSCNKIVTLDSYTLRHHPPKSCGCKRRDSALTIDLKDQTFGYWHVIRRADELEESLFEGGTRWLCECTKCGKKDFVLSGALRNGTSKSCGCARGEFIAQTSLERYGVKHPAMLNAGTDRTLEQMKLMEDEEKLVTKIKETFGCRKPTAEELGDMLGVTRGSAKSFMRRHGLDEYMTIGQMPFNGFEEALNNIFPCEHRHDKTVLNGQELDLYYPEHKIAIEFNGNYWHSTHKKDSNYHIRKRMDASKRGVRIIHFFEHEWRDKESREKIIRLIARVLKAESFKTVYARHCEVKIVNKKEASDFLDKWHLQDSCDFRVAYGMYYSGELVEVMAFGAPRFDKGVQWELIRLATHGEYIVVGGASRLFTHFIRENNPTSVESYCDAAKFSGNVYVELGFKPSKLTRPNYKWVNPNNGLVLSRYQTMKHRLVSAGLGNEEDTEDDIMERNGYLKIYDCGNMKFIWEAE